MQTCGPRHWNVSIPRAVLALCAISMMISGLLTQQTYANGDDVREIRNLLEVTWHDALNANYNAPGYDVDDHATAMANLYAQDSELLPTVKPGVWQIPGGVHGGGAIKTYFKNYFLPQKPLLQLPITHHNVRLLGSKPAVMENGVLVTRKYASNQGLYTFHLQDDGNGNAINPPAVVRARFSFVYERVGTGDPVQWGPWKIIQHHSSAEPGLAPPNRAEDIRALLTDWGDLLRQWQPGYADDNPWCDPSNYPFPNAHEHAWEMARRYAQGNRGEIGSLLPTVKPGLFMGHGMIQTYFVTFLKQKPKLVQPVVQDHVGFMGNRAYHQGLYEFKLYAKPNGDPWPADQAGIEQDDRGRFKRAYARFTFVYKKGMQNNWSDSKIIMHHSSLEPSMNAHLAKCPADHTGPDGTPDGKVDVVDLLFLLKNWGPCP